MDEFTDKVVCVTGASRGIGRAVAEAFGRSRARLLLLARSEALFETAAYLRESTEVLPIRCDVALYDQVRHAVESAISSWNRIDVLVNAAAVLGATGELWFTDPHDWSAAIQTNLIGTYNTMRAVLPFMISERRGKIINFAGGGAAYGYPKFSAYAASKAAVVRLTETADLELSPYNVQVNVVAPGAIETEMLKAVRAAGGEVHHNVGTMQQAVDVVLFLASTLSDHITGRFIHAKDPYREFKPDMPTDMYTLRRVQP